MKLIIEVKKENHFIFTVLVNFVGKFSQRFCVVGKTCTASVVSFTNIQDWYTGWPCLRYYANPKKIHNMPAIQYLRNLSPELQSAINEKFGSRRTDLTTYKPRNA